MQRAKKQHERRNQQIDQHEKDGYLIAYGASKILAIFHISNQKIFTQRTKNFYLLYLIIDRQYTWLRFHALMKFASKQK